MFIAEPAQYQPSAPQKRPTVSQGTAAARPRAAAAGYKDIRTITGLLLVVLVVYGLKGADSCYFN